MCFRGAVGHGFHKEHSGWEGGDELSSIRVVHLLQVNRWGKETPKGCGGIPVPQIHRLQPGLDEFVPLHCSSVEARPQLIHLIEELIDRLNRLRVVAVIASRFH